MSTTTDDLKTRHRAMWALGDYPAVATEVIAPLGDVLVDACGIGPGQRVVDVAAGSGNAAIPAARRGADVVATDLTPELLDIGRRAADAEGVSLRWRIADAEDMPCEDGEQDVAISCVGVMFAPHHQAAADELVRIVRPGGTIGLISWTPEGFIGQMFATMRPFVPAPPPGVQPPPLWGHLDHVRDLLGDRVTDIDASQQKLRVTNFASGARVPGLLQGDVRTHDRGVPRHRRRPGPRRRAGPRAGGAGRPLPGRRRHGVGVPARHRRARLTVTPRSCGAGAERR